MTCEVLDYQFNCHGHKKKKKKKDKKENVKMVLDVFIQKHNVP